MDRDVVILESGGERIRRNKARIRVAFEPADSENRRTQKMFDSLTIQFFAPVEAESAFKKDGQKFSDFVGENESGDQKNSDQRGQNAENDGLSRVNRADQRDERTEENDYH